MWAIALVMFLIYWANRKRVPEETIIKRNSTVKDTKDKCPYCKRITTIRTEYGQMLEYKYPEELWVEYVFIKCLKCKKEDFSN